MPQACQQSPKRGPINFDGQDLADELNKKDWSRSLQGPYMKDGPYRQFPFPQFTIWVVPFFFSFLVFP